MQNHLSISDQQKQSCKLHQENKIVGVCYNTQGQHGPLYCIDCMTLDHPDHLQVITYIYDLQIILEKFIQLQTIDYRTKGSNNQNSEIQEQFKDLTTQKQELDQKGCHSITQNNLNKNIHEYAKCESILEQCEIKNDVKDNICKSYLGLKCSKCQQFFNQPLLKIENDIYCQECIKCHECNLSKPSIFLKRFFFENEVCLKISQNSVLKKEMIAYIKKYFGTKQKKVDNNEKIITFQSEPYKCLNLKDYSGYIIGYNHPLIKSITIIPQKHQLTLEQADKQLNEDIDQFEKELYEFYQRKDKKPEDIPENVRMLMLFILFIFKDFNQVIKLAYQQTYFNLYFETIKIQYPKDWQILKGRVEKALDFFNDRFHREDGSVRQKTILNVIKKELPTHRRNQLI